MSPPPCSFLQLCHFPHLHHVFLATLSLEVFTSNLCNFSVLHCLLLFSFNYSSPMLLFNFHYPISLCFEGYDVKSSRKLNENLAAVFRVWPEWDSRVIYIWNPTRTCHVSAALLKISFQDCTCQKMISDILKIWRKASERKPSKLTNTHVFYITEIYISFCYHSFLIPTASPNLNTMLIRTYSQNILKKKNSSHNWKKTKQK